MSRPILHRPTLLPGLPRIWRGERTLQLGLHPARAVLIDLPDPAAAAVLDLLDGTRPERSVVLAAADQGIRPSDAAALVDLLHEAGLVVPAQRLYPPALDAPTRRLLAGEAAALALQAHEHRRPTPVAGPHSPAPQAAAPSPDPRGPGPRGPVSDPPPSAGHHAPDPGASASSTPLSHGPGAPAPGSPLAPDPRGPGPGHHAPSPGASASGTLSATASGTPGATASGTPSATASGTPSATDPRASGSRGSATGPRGSGSGRSGSGGSGSGRSGSDGSGSGAPSRPSPASILRKRRDARVVLTGRSRLAAGVAVALAQAGVGALHADLTGTVTDDDRIAAPLDATTVGTPRADAVTEALRRAAPAVETRPVRRGSASLVVQFPGDQPVALLALAHLQRRQPYLAVTVREATAVVGPLVTAAGRPCLHCLSLHRHEHIGDALHRVAHPLPGDTPGTPWHPAPDTPWEHSGHGSSWEPPVPGTSAEHPAPAISREHSAPTTSRGHSAPATSREHPALGTSRRHSAPATSREHPALGTSRGHSAPATSWEHPEGDPHGSAPPSTAAQHAIDRFMQAAARPGQEPLTVATALAAIGFIVSEVTTFLDGGRPESLSAEVEIAGAGRPRRRTWPPHPACACATSRRRP